MANRRITEFPAIAANDIVDQDVMTLVHVFEADPSLRNKKITFEQFKNYLNTYYASTSGATFSGNVAISGNLTVSGLGSFDTIFSSGLSTFSSSIVQNNIVVSGTISGATVTGTNLQGVNVNATTVTTATATGTTSLFTSGQYQSLSGATITGGQGAFVSGTFVNLSGVTITGTTVAATTGTFQTLSTPVLSIGGNLSVASGITVTGTAQFAADVRVTGTLSGTTVTGTTARFSTVSGVSGVFTTNLSGATITGNTVQASNVTGVSGTFTTRISGATVTGNTGAFGNVSGISGVFTQFFSGAVITGDTGRYTTLTGVSGTFTTVSGATVTGNTVAATIVSGVSGVFTSQLSATTITGASGVFTNLTSTSGIFTTQVSGATVTGNIGTFTSLTGATGTFTTRVSGLLVTGDTGSFTNLTGIAGVFTTSVSGATITGNTIQGTSGVFTNLSGTTYTGTTVNATTGVFQTLAAINLAFTNTTVSGNLNVLGSGFFASGVQITGTLSGVTVTGTTANFTSGNFTNISGGTHTITSGVFAAGSAASPSITFTGDLNTGIYSPGADQVAISTGGSGRLFVDASGNVGVGASPAVALDVASADETQARIRATTNGVDVRLTALGLTGNAGQTGTWSNHSFVLRTNNQERLRITSAGLIGIGGSTPGTLLHCQQSSAGTIGTFNYTSSTGGGAEIRVANGYSSTTPIYSFWFNNTTGIGNPAANEISLITSGSEKARIDSSGRLLVGTSTKLGSTEKKLEVANGSFGISSFANNAFASAIVLEKGRGTVPGTIVQNGDELGALLFRADDGVDSFTTAASIYAYVDGTPGANDMPGRLVFSTTADGASSPTERMRISSAGTTTLTSAGSTAPFIANIGASEVARIDSSGNLLMGTSSPISVPDGQTLPASRSPKFQIASNLLGATISSIAFFNTSDNIAEGAGCFSFSRSNTETIGSHAIVSSGDVLGKISYSASDGDSYVEAASIIAAVDGTPGLGDMPGRLVFSTTADGTSFPIERMRISNAGTTTLTSAAATAPFIAKIDGTEVARIDSSGRLLVGTSSALVAQGVTSSLQLHGATAGQGGGAQSISYWQNNTTSSALLLNKSRGATPGSYTIVQDGDGLGTIAFGGADGTAIVRAAVIDCQVDGTPGTNDMPGRIVLATTSDGTANPLERLRITNDGVIAYNQVAPNVETAAATLLVAELKTGIIQYTGAAATLTLPTGTLTEGGFSGIYTNMTFEWSVINTGSGTCTIGNGTGHTVTGSATVAAGTSGRFASRRTAANTFVSYRLS